LQDGRVIGSTQIVQEFVNVVTRKFEAPLSIGKCRKYLDPVLAGLCRINVFVNLCQTALDMIGRGNTAIEFSDYRRCATG
jgi:hypothetical protein